MEHARAQFFKSFTIEKKVNGRWDRLFHLPVFTDDHRLKKNLPKGVKFPEIPGLEIMRIIKFFGSAAALSNKDSSRAYTVSQEFGPYRLTQVSRPNTGVFFRFFLKKKHIRFKSQELVCK